LLRGSGFGALQALGDACLWAVVPRLGRRVFGRGLWSRPCTDPVDRLVSAAGCGLSARHRYLRGCLFGTGIPGVHRSRRLTLAATVASLAGVGVVSGACVIAAVAIIPS